MLYVRIYKRIFEFWFLKKRFRKLFRQNLIRITGSVFPLQSVIDKERLVGEQNVGILDVQQPVLTVDKKGGSPPDGPFPELDSLVTENDVVVSLHEHRGQDQKSD